MPESVYVPLLAAPDARAIATLMPMPLGRRDAKHSRVIFSTWIAAWKLGIAHRYVQGRIDRCTLRTRGDRLMRSGVIDVLAREELLGLPWKEIFAPEQHGRVAAGRWYGHNPRHRLIAKYRPIIESEWQSASDLLAAAGSNGDGLAMLRPISGLDDLSPAARRYARASAQRQGTTAGGASDAIASMGDERRWTCLANTLARDTSQACLSLARKSPDVADRLDAWLVRHHVRSRKHRPIVSVPVEWLRHRTFRVCGLPAEVVDSVDGKLLVLDGETIPVDMLDGFVPADQGWFRLVDVMPEFGAACPF